VRALQDKDQDRARYQTLQGFGYGGLAPYSVIVDDDVLVSLATCLGDVIAAQLQATGQAVGVREDGTEVICLASDQAAVSDALKGDVPSTREPWDELLPGAEVDEDNGLARVTVPAAEKGRPVGRVLRLMVNGDLDGLR
jgi:hypothetical protein